MEVDESMKGKFETLWVFFDDDDGDDEHKLCSGLAEILCLCVCVYVRSIESVTDSKVLFLKIQRE